MKKTSLHNSHFRLPPLQAGFTLTELLLSAAIVTSTVAISGMGMSTMITSSKVTNESNERQDELNRALDFISSEIRQAKFINKGAVPDPYDDNLDPAVVKLSSVKPILWLNMGAGKKVVYYVGQPANENGPWRSPQILFRWGGQYNSNGRLNNSTDHRVLMDSLHSEINGGNPPSCPDPSWSQPISDPNTAKNLGFYACVAPNHRTAILSQVGHVRQVLERSEFMKKERQVYSRASDPPTPPTGMPNNTPEPGGRIRSTGSSLTDITITPKGGAITCGANGPTIPTETSVVWRLPNAEPTTEVIPPNGITRRVPEGTELSFFARRLRISDCSVGEYRVDSEQDIGTQVISLVNNEEIPYYRPFSTQSSIDSFLQDNLDANNRLSIADNQRVFLFELGEEYSLNPGPAYDFQDVVLLTEMTPVTRQVDPIDGV